MQANYKSKLVVVMHVYNEELRIERCLHSLKIQNIDFLCVISDNRSTDNTLSLINRESNLDSRFIVIQPEKHLSQMDHYIFICDFVFKKIQNSQYIMTLGADDVLLSDNYLASLSKWLDQNLDYQLVSPQIINCNIGTGKTSVVSPHLSSRYSFVRLLKFSTQSSSSGFINFVNGMMRTHTYLNYSKLWAYYGDLEIAQVSQRKIKTEFAVFIDLIILAKVGNCSSVKLFKEVGNRSSNENRKSLDIKSSESKTLKSNSGLVANLNHQIRSMLIPYNAYLYFKNQSSAIHNIYSFVYACLSLITNLYSLILFKLNRVLRGST